MRNPEKWLTAEDYRLGNYDSLDAIYYVDREADNLGLYGKKEINDVDGDLTGAGLVTLYFDTGGRSVPPDTLLYCEGLERKPE